MAAAFAARMERGVRRMRAALCPHMLVLQTLVRAFFSKEYAIPEASLVKAPGAMKDYGDVDRWIAQLMECKPLSEAEVIQLCARVS